MIKMPNPNQEPPASSKAANQDLNDMDLLCTFKIKMESQNLQLGYVKDQRLYPNQDQNSKSLIPKSGLKGHGCALHLQNKDREQNFGTFVNQRPLTISKLG